MQICNELSKAAVLNLGVRIPLGGAQAMSRGTHKANLLMISICGNAGLKCNM